MDIRLLGPVEVVADDGSPLPLSAAMLRTTLAALALRSGQVVPADELAARLWGDEPPASVRATVRNYVRRLRRAIPGERILTVSGGYQLRVERAETDLGRFREALDRARGLATGAPAQAAQVLDEAMKLWRGTPLANLSDSPLRAQEQPRLEELYLTAVEERFELKLALGEHAAVTEELTAAARAHPLRERLTWQLMVALYRCGRTAESLGVYRGARERLVRELGIEPGTALRELEQAILRDDPWLASPAPPAVTPEVGPAPGAALGEGDASSDPPPAPSFPPSIATFVARGVELARLRGWLADTTAAPALAVLDGPGGVGKSALAVRAAREVADRFPDGLLYVDLRGADPGAPPLEPAEARAVLLASLGVPGKDVPAEPEAATAFFRRRLRGCRVLVLLDNARDAEQVRTLLPTEAGQAALVTARSALPGMRGVRRLHLEPLATADAVGLLQAVAGCSTERGSPAEWEELAALCGRLPLALDLVGTRMATRPAWRVAHWSALLADERGRMDELAVDDRDVRASLLVTVDQLAASADPAERLAGELFPLLGAASVHTHSASTLAALTGRDPRLAGRTLELLTDARIAVSPRPGVYALHDLVRSAAAWRAGRLPTAQVRAHLADLARWYLGSLYRMNGPFGLPEFFHARYRDGADRYPAGRPFGTVDESLPWADEALPEILLLAHQLAAAEYDTGAELSGCPLSGFALESLRALESYFGMRLTWGAQRRLCELALEVGRRRGDLFAQAVAHGQLGKLTGQQGDGVRGVELLERSVAMFQAVGEEQEAIGAMSNLVPCLGSAGRLGEALETAERALEAAARVGLPELCSLIRNNLGRCHLYLGHHDQAHRVLTENYRTTEIPYQLTVAAGVLSEYHLETGEFEAAALWAERSLRHAAEHPFDPFVAAQQRTWLAAALRGLGLEERARAEEARAQVIVADLNQRENSHLRVRPEERYSTT